MTATSARTFIVGLVLAITSLAAPVQASLIVNWGAPGGDTGIITSGNADNSTIGTTYTSGTTITDPISYYESYDGSQTPLFNGAETNNGNLEIRNATDGDWFQAPSNTGFTTNRHEVMYVWETGDMINGGGAGKKLTNFSIESRDRNNNTDDDAHVRFLVEESSQFYISQIFSVPGNLSWGSISQDPSALSWNLFTPFSSGTATIGASATPTLTDVDSVGFFASSFDDNVQFTAVQTRHFSVTAVVPEPSSFSVMLVGMAGLCLYRRRRSRK